MGKIIFTIVMLLPATMLAQFNMHHSSTLDEGIQRGRADLLRGTAQLLQGSARATEILQSASSKALDNDIKAAATFWAKKGMYAENRPLTYLEHENKRLQGLLAAHDLQMKKDSLVNEGVISRPPMSHFTYNGHSYTSYEKFTKSGDHIRMKLEAELSRIEDRLSEQLTNERCHEALVRTVLRERGYIK